MICHKDGRRLQSVKKSFLRLLRRCDIQDASLHTLRHSFASYCVMHNIDLYTVKEFLGHSQITTTEIYAHISHEFKQKNIEKLMPMALDIGVEKDVAYA